MRYFYYYQMTKCKRCKYNSIKYTIDYYHSVREQKCIGHKEHYCKICGTQRQNQKYEYFKYELNNIPEDVTAVVDLTKIVHDCNEHLDESSGGTEYQFNNDIDECVGIIKYYYHVW